MAISGKEQESIDVGIEQAALKEVDGYLEAVEKKPEIDEQTAIFVQPSPSLTPTPPVVTDDRGQVVLSDSQPKPTAIKLPLSETEVRDGLHHKIIDSLRWLAEFCVYLIKKYPGRVFYKAESESTS